MRGIQMLRSTPMFPCERANWFDTEGNLYVSPLTKPLTDSVVSMCVGQVDRAPLNAFAHGASLAGIATRIERKKGNGEGYRLTIDRISDVARELLLELPFIRTRRKVDEIRAFVSYLERKRTLERDEIRRAREAASEWDLSAVPSRRAMDPMDRANWHETEGCLSLGPRAFQLKSGAALIVSQFEIEPLEAFTVGCARDGIACHLYQKRAETGNGILRED